MSTAIAEPPAPTTALAVSKALDRLKTTLIALASRAGCDFPLQTADVWIGYSALQFSIDEQSSLAAETIADREAEIVQLGLRVKELTDDLRYRASLPDSYDPTPDIETASPMPAFAATDGGPEIDF